MESGQPYVEKKRQPSKGERLGWTPLKDVQSVSLNGVKIVGKVVDVRESQTCGKNNKNIFIIP